MADTWKDAILGGIRKRKGREITLKSIYKEVLFLPIVTDFHKEPWKPEKQPKYKCWIRSEISINCSSNIFQENFA